MERRLLLNLLRRVITMDDTFYMHQALAMARKAMRFKEVPVGAIIVCNGTIIAQAHNLTQITRDPTAHAERLVLQRAAEILGDWRLTSCVLYCTVEPCIQCAGAMLLARIKRLVFGCPDPKMGAVESLYHLLDDERLNHRVAVTGGILKTEAADLMRTFFKTLREKP